MTSSMNALAATRNAERAECTVPAPESGVVIGSAKESSASPEHVPGKSHDNGFRWGPRNFVTSAGKPETNANRTVPGVSIADVGFELLAHDGTFVAWFLCPIDACDAMKVREAPGKIVRCSDRALIKVRYPRRSR